MSVWVVDTVYNDIFEGEIVGQREEDRIDVYTVREINGYRDVDTVEGFIFNSYNEAKEKLKIKLIYDIEKKQNILNRL